MAKKRSATKQKLFDISRQLMMSKGYNATTIEEICTSAEVTKGAFFYYFKTKEDLGVNLLQEYWRVRQNQFADVDWMAAEDPLEQIQQFLQVVADVFMNDPDGYSCLAGSFTQELANANPLFRELVSSLFVEWAQQITPILQAAKEKYAPSDEINVQQLADYIVSVIQGCLILAQARQDGGVIRQQMQMLSKHLLAVFGS